MLKNKTKIMICVILIMIIFFSIVPTNKVQATGLSWDAISGAAKEWINKGKQDSPIDLDAMERPIIELGQVLMGIAVAVLVICSTIMGIQYMTAPPDKQGKLKQQAVGLLVSAVVIFGAWGIWSFVYNIMTDITG